MTRPNLDSWAAFEPEDSFRGNSTEHPKCVNCGCDLPIGTGNHDPLIPRYCNPCWEREFLAEWPELRNSQSFARPVRRTIYMGTPSGSIVTGSEVTEETYRMYLENSALQLSLQFCGPLHLKFQAFFGKPKVKEKERVNVSGLCEIGIICKGECGLCVQMLSNL